MLKTNTLILIIVLLFIQCKTQEVISYKKLAVSVSQLKTKLNKEEKNTWQHKGFDKNSILGIDSHSAYDFIKNKKKEEVIVAVLDLEVNINHKDLNGRVWINTDEIPNNGIDDDNNGYIDDIHGWNFLGTTEKDSVLYQHSESLRIIEKYNKVFEGKQLKDIEESQIADFKLYKKAKTFYDSKFKEAKENADYFRGFKERYLKLIDTMYVLFKTKEFTISQLDSLKQKSTDSIILDKIGSTRYCVENSIDEKWINKVIKLHSNRKTKIYNSKHKDRLTKDNPFDITDTNYGNNNVRGTRKMSHGTKVAGLIAATRNNDYGIDGINEDAKIMPVVVSANGNEYDKDIALGIRYAVDNGAKIINLSIGKEFSMNNHWILDAIKYAESKDVLLITSAGNNSVNTDDNDISYYPNDMDVNNNEIVNNFIVVGSTSYKKGVVSDFSNYGKTKVDIFAPGENIKVITRKSYTIDSGTSLSCAIVSGIASLIRSTYPNLTAQEVKNILLDSGTNVDAQVYIPNPQGEKRNPNKVPFSSLSKSGKIVNAYNVLLMAEEVSKKKKRK